MGNLTIDQNHIWHPYSAMHSDLPIYLVKSANGVRLTLDDGRELIDGMSSWWCVIHGYNHPEINAALKAQIDRVAHVMFGGLTHQPAIELTQLLLKITPEPLQNVFYSDSGSVAVEVAMKMAIQFWQAKNKPKRTRFIALRAAYHGDTFAAMSVCDPVTGMHNLFKGTITEQIFVKQPTCRFGQPCTTEDLADLEKTIKYHADETAALIMEPIVQGAGGMWFYSAEYLKRAKALCEQYNILLILDEIATGFGRTGKMFACEHAGIAADIMCIGKSLTAGYLSLAATLTTNAIATTIDQGDPGVFMHGPTFMANPLACTAAIANIKLLITDNWQENIQRLHQGLENGLAPCSTLEQVNDVRVLGAIGVVEMKQAVDMKRITEDFVNAAVWIRPFGKLVYLMPPFIISNEDLEILTRAVFNVLKGH
jgi:adenosylmethionine-8-amino-7-oxononanoate aminotransferase